MYLTSTSLVHYLLACGHVGRPALVHAPFSVFEIDGHHRSFRVNVGSTGGLFVKQLRAPDQDSIDCLCREAACHRLACSDSKFAAWQRLLPRLISDDAARHILIFEQIADAENLVQCHRRLASFPVDLARLLGTSLADLHTTTRGISRPSGAIFPSGPPWLFRFHEPGDANSSGAVRQLASIVSQDNVLSPQLAELDALWSQEVLIHGDLKWSNCLVSPQPDNKPQLHLVDWEMASWGDPLWDVAGGLTGYLLETLLHGSRYADRRATALEDTDFLALAQPPMQALWLAYCQRMDYGPARGAEHALRCVRFLGARLLLTLIEYHQHSRELGDASGPLLEASRMLLRDPPRMAASLLGGATT